MDRSGLGFDKCRTNWTDGTGQDRRKDRAGSRDAVASKKTKSKSKRWKEFHKSH